MATRFQVTFDCADPDAQAEFWKEALHYAYQPPPDGYESWDAFVEEHNLQHLTGTISAVVDPDSKGPRLLFLKVPEGKVAKNRLHLDLNVSGGPAVPVEERAASVRAEAQRLVGLGARQIEEMTREGEFWVVMNDPEGNEFCLQ